MAPEAPRIIEPFADFRGVAYPAGTSPVRRAHHDLPHDDAQVSPRTTVREPLERGYRLQSPPGPRVVEIQDDPEDRARARARPPFLALCRGDDARSIASPAFPAPRPVGRSPRLMDFFALPPADPWNSPLGFFRDDLPGGANGLRGPEDAKPAAARGDVITISSGSSSGRGSGSDGSLGSGSSSEGEGGDDGADPYADAAAHVSRAVHDACLAATQRHLRALRTNWHLRTCSPYADEHHHHHQQPGGGGPGAIRRRRCRRERTGSTRPSPYARPPAQGGHRRASSDPGRGSQAHHHHHRDYHGSQHGAARPCSSHGHGGGGGDDDDGGSDGGSDDDWIARARRRGGHPAVPIPAPSHSLLANAHALSGAAWRRAARDRLDVLGAERDALADMRDLTAWAETVVLSAAAVGAAGVGGTESSGGPPAAREVVRAGRGLCWWLRDAAALEEVERVALEAGLSPPPGSP